MRLRRYVQCPAQLARGVQCQLDRLHWVPQGLAMLHAGEDARTGEYITWRAFPVELMSHTTEGADQRRAVELWRDASAGRPGLTASVTQELLDPTTMIELLAIGWRRGFAAGLTLSQQLNLSDDEIGAWDAGRTS